MEIQFKHVTQNAKVKVIWVKSVFKQNYSKEKKQEALLAARHSWVQVAALWLTGLSPDAVSQGHKHTFFIVR